MSTHIKETQANKSQSMAEWVSKSDAGRVPSGNVTQGKLQRVADVSTRFVDNRPEAAMQREMVLLARVPIQRTLTIGVTPVSEDGELPEEAEAVIKEAGETSTEGRIRDLIRLWRKDDVPREYSSWQVAIANAFMELNDWVPSEVTIVDPGLTAGNCHGLTFGGGGTEIINFSSVKQLMDCWDNGPRIMVCLLGGKVGHTATFTDDGWRQTLPRGPVFTSTRVALEKRYTCYDTGVPNELEALREMKPDEVSEEQAAAFERLKGEMLTKLGKALANPEFKENGVYHDAKGWLIEIRKMEGFSPVKMEELEEYKQQLTDMECPGFI